MITFEDIDIESLKKFATKLIAEIKNTNIVVFIGEMGAGKTTLIKQICKQMGVLDIIQSPTFSIVNQYVTKENKPIYHFDFYRIKNEEESLDIGIEEYFYSDNLCLIEWPEKIPTLLPKNHLKVTIKRMENNNRFITISL